MNVSRSRSNLPSITVLCAAAGLLLRRLLYAFALDEKGLLVPFHPFELALSALSLGFLVYLGLTVRKLGGSEAYEHNFSPSPRARLSYLLGAVGIGLTVLLNGPKMPGLLGTAWVILGGLSPVCLIAAGLARGKGRRPFFLLHLTPCLFLVVHIITHYQTWSGNPQLQDDIYAIFGTMAAMFFLFHCANFDVGTGHRRMQLFLGLAGAYLCFVNIWNTEYLFLYAGLACLCGGGICNPEPVAVSQPAAQEAPPEGEDAP